AAQIPATPNQSNSGFCQRQQDHLPTAISLIEWTGLKHEAVFAVIAILVFNRDSSRVLLIPYSLSQEFPHGGQAPCRTVKLNDRAITRPVSRDLEIVIKSLVAEPQAKLLVQ